MKAVPILLAALVVTVVSAGCASVGQMDDNAKLALYRANALEPVPSFHYYGNLSGWTPLGEVAVAVWTRPNEAYLLEVDGPCPDLDYAQAIALTQRSGMVYARFDKVIPHRGGSNTQALPCQIREILPLDVEAIKAAEKAARDEREGNRS
jgi:hypothetical protein